MDRYAKKERLQKRRNKLLQRAERLVSRARRERGEDTDLTREERDRFDDLLEQVEQLNEDIKNLPRRRPVARGAFAGGETQDQGDNVSKTKRERAVEAFIRRGERRDELRAADQSIGVKAEGGALASTGFFPELQEVLQQFGGVRNTRARVFQTSHGRAFNVPGLDDAENKASQVNEGSTISGTTNLVFSDVQMTAFTFQAGPVTATFEQLQDSELGVEDIVLDSLGTRIARAIEEDYAGSTVTSSTAINGVVTVSTGAVSMAAGSSNLNFQLVRDLMFSVDADYREDAEWGVSDSALQALSDIEDADGRPILQPDVREDIAGRLYGKPVHVIQGLGSIDSSSQLPIFFGDWRRGYAIRDVTSVEMVRLDEKYAHRRRTGFMSWFRTDGRALFSSTISSSNRPLRALKTT